MSRLNKPNDPATVSIIIVSYNCVDVLKVCISSIFENTTYPYEIVVVDNNSMDGTIEYLKTLCDKKFVSSIFNDTNGGFSVAANKGIRKSSGEYIVLLNPDTIVTKDWTSRFIFHFCNTTGAVGPISNYAAGNQRATNFLAESYLKRSNINDIAIGLA